MANARSDKTDNFLCLTQLKTQYMERHEQLEETKGKFHGQCWFSRCCKINEKIVSF